MKLVVVKSPLDYKIGGATTLREAVTRDCRLKYGPGAKVTFYYGLPDGTPISSLNGKLLLGEPEPTLIARVIPGDE